MDRRKFIKSSGILGAMGVAFNPLVTLAKGLVRDKYQIKITNAVPMVSFIYEKEYIKFRNTFSIREWNFAEESGETGIKAEINNDGIGIINLSKDLIRDGRQFKVFYKIDCLEKEYYEKYKNKNPKLILSDDLILEGEYYANGEKGRIEDGNYLKSYSYCIIIKSKINEAPLVTNYLFGFGDSPFVLVSDNRKKYIIGKIDKDGRCKKPSLMNKRWLKENGPAHVYSVSDTSGYCFRTKYAYKNFPYADSLTHNDKKYKWPNQKDLDFIQRLLVKNNVSLKKKLCNKLDVE